MAAAPHSGAASPVSTLVNDTECVAFLQWALPRLGMRWRGFRRVRRQVCRRIGRRIAELGLRGIAEYRAILDRSEEEWPVLDRLCRITISRFYRDRGVFESLVREVLPALAVRRLGDGRGPSAGPAGAGAELPPARNRSASFAGGHAGLQPIRAWSAGCGSGEEPYTLSIAWELAVRPSYPAVDLQVVATDADARLLERARQGRYGAGSLRELPGAWREAAFEAAGPVWRLKPEFRRAVEFRCEDIREKMPGGLFDLVLCRNLVFTYFDENLQRELLKALVARLDEGGVLVVGRHETTPRDREARAWSSSHQALHGEVIVTDRSVDGRTLRPWHGKAGIYCLGGQ